MDQPQKKPNFMHTIELVAPFLIDIFDVKSPKFAKYMIMLTMHISATQRSFKIAVWLMRISSIIALAATIYIVTTKWVNIEAQGIDGRAHDIHQKSEN